MVMRDEWFFDRQKRKIIVTGHYGSGKTEFSVSLAMMLAKAQIPGQRVSLIDLDIVNPYFRSRERRELLENAGVSVYGSAYDKEITLELPALGAGIRAPLEDESARVVVDLGGNDSGALIINQFAKYFTSCDTIMAAVVNANRPDTGAIEGALEHIAAIEKITGLTISHIINNTHMLRETTAADIEKGYKLCMNICAATGRKLLCNCYPDGIVSPGALTGVSGNLMPLGLYMRPTWL